jgi:hypothetical protein
MSTCLNLCLRIILHYGIVKIIQLQSEEVTVLGTELLLDTACVQVYYFSEDTQLEH